MAIDNRTVLTVGTVAALGISGFCFLFQWKRQTCPGFRNWSFGCILVAVGLLLLALRGIIPEKISIFGTNISVFLAALNVLRGTREFCGKSPRWWPAYVCGAASIVASLYFSAVHNSAARIAIFSLYMAFTEVATAMTLFRNMARERKLGYWFTGLLFTGVAVLNLAHGAFLCFQWPVRDVLAAGYVNQVYYACVVFVLVELPFGFVLLTNDRLILELVVAREEAQGADRAKTQFLAHMSHEIRTPLNGILGLTGLALDGPLTEDKRQELEAVRHSGETLLRIVDDILDLAKIEAGKLAITESPFDLYATLTQIATLFGEQAARKSVRLYVTYPFGMPHYFLGDETRVRQIVANFASNAVKFTSSGEVEIGVLQTNHSVRISVRDTGIGIEPQTLPHLFSRFVQAEASTARRYGGTGLGLAIARQLAQLMGGTAGAESKTGEGSTFWVDLPLTPAARVPEPETKETDLQGLAGVRILVAEDNPVNQLLLVRLLEKHGLVVDVACNGDEAARNCEHRNYAAVLMDCQMPQVGGYEAARRIRHREERLGCHTPIIAVTAHAMPGEQELCRAAGMDDYLTKPINSPELLKRLAEYVKLQQQDASAASHCA